MTARVVMVFTKTYQTKNALLGVLPKMNSKTTYLSLQNGLGNGKILSDITHSNSILHGVTMLPATLLKAGHVKSKGVNTTWFGSYKSAEHNIAHSILHDLIKCDFDVSLVENPNIHIWQKACFNISLNAISALINGSPGLIGDFPGVKNIVPPQAQRPADSLPSGREPPKRTLSADFAKKLKVAESGKKPPRTNPTFGREYEKKGGDT